MLHNENGGNYKEPQDNNLYDGLYLYLLWPINNLSAGESIFSMPIVFEVTDPYPIKSFII